MVPVTARCPQISFILQRHGNLPIYSTALSQLPISCLYHTNSYQPSSCTITSILPPLIFINFFMNFFHELFLLTDEDWVFDWRFGHGGGQSEWTHRDCQVRMILLWRVRPYIIRTSHVHHMYITRTSHVHYTYIARTSQVHHKYMCRTGARDTIISFVCHRIVRHHTRVPYRHCFHYPAST